ncbi:MAG: DUF4255 domain-containing protein [Actinomycetota bacterium]|nr:DUF4255 domain-containing protein [Actinomycetota bacterium]
MIGLVSESLKQLLETEMGEGHTISIQPPTAEGSGLSRVNLFAYRLSPNSFLLNRDMVPVPDEPGQAMKPPLGLRVFYLVTAYASSDSALGDAGAHNLLGEAMRIFHENPIIPQDLLVEELRGTSLRITLQMVDPDEVSRVWTALDQPFQLCAIYEVATLDLVGMGRYPVAPTPARTAVTVGTIERSPEVTR